MEWKRRWPIILTFLVGLLIGALGASVLVAWHWNRNFESWYAVNVGGQALTALEIREGRASEVAARIEESIPGYVRALDGELAGSDASVSGLWMVRHFYERTSAEPSEEVRRVLDRLPPEPKSSCPLPHG